MNKRPRNTVETAPQTEIGPYDGCGAKEPWFLSDDEAMRTDYMPLPQTNRRPLINLRDWEVAQAHLAADLASVAMLFGALDERLRALPKGWQHRLALLEATELSWWVGDRIALDRLALWDKLRLSGVQDDSQALARAGWALRRLSGGSAYDVSSQGISAFLGRANAATGDVQDMASLIAAAAHLHPITRSAIAFHGWRMLGTGGAATEGEALVMAARQAAVMGRGQLHGLGAVFMPIALAGAAAGSGGSALDQLTVWLRGAERAILAALLHLDRVSAWQIRALSNLADLQGRTPALLINGLAEWPMITAPMAESITQSSRATVQRNLTLMQTRELIREVTGHNRYRVWTAKI